MTDRYAAFDRLLFERPAPHVLRVTLNAPDRLNAVDAPFHLQLERVWAVIDQDPEVRCTIVTGAGRAFCAGADIAAASQAKPLDPGQTIAYTFSHATSLVRALIDAKKPIVSAINGPAVGAGLALALLSDVPIAARHAKLVEGHLNLGAAAGDHAAIIWPLLCGMAKAKYYILTNSAMTGEEAERNNLVALAVDAGELQERALEVARQIARGAPTAIRMNKHVLNHWLRQNQPLFELSTMFEAANLASGESTEAIRAFMSKSEPDYTEESYFT